MFNQNTHTMLTSLDEALQATVARAYTPETAELHFMLQYAMGWAGPDAGPAAQGKRIRPLLLLLVTEAAGGEWRQALPAAAAVELLHNFTLIHDDIEDQSPTRRGRPTLWQQWGIPQAINTGDLMFTLAQDALTDLADTLSAQQTVAAIKLFNQACLQLTQGQFLDLHYQERDDISLAEYWPMIEGKTAALVAVAAQLGALAAGADEATQLLYRDFGKYLGLAYQSKDDYLGIWGDTAATGKSNQSDLMSGKKSLPVVYALQQDPRFGQELKAGMAMAETLPQIVLQLETMGGQTFTASKLTEFTERALWSLKEAQPSGEAGQFLYGIAQMLLERKG